MARMLVVCAVCSVTVGVAHAERFDFEFAASYSETELSDGPFERDFSASAKLSGAWFYRGFSDDEGPRALAAFTDRASSIEILYGVDDKELFHDITMIDLSARHVWRDSGWFLAGAISANDVETEFTTDQ
ncbi:MAG: hypothetical protein AAFV47_08270 [Pseudomonadota bacterium]